MGNSMTIRNETPYDFSYVCVLQIAQDDIKAGGVVTCGNSVTIHHEVLPSFMYLKYGHHSHHETRYNGHLSRDYNPIDNPSLIIRIRGYDQSIFELTCDKGGGISTCPNYGKEESDRIIRERELQREEEMRREEQRRQEEQRREEEKRRQEKIERERRIQEEIESESKALEEKLSQSSEKIQAKRQQAAHFQERSLTLRFVVDDDADSIDINEIKEVEDNFRNLLTDYHIDEDETMRSRNIAERIMVLQHKMVTVYSIKKNLPLQFLQNLDDFFCYENLSLTENMNLLEAIVNVSLTDSEVDDLSMLQKASVMEERSYFILCIMSKLCKNSKTVAGNITKSLLHNFSQYSQELIGYLIFSEIWTPVQAFEFYLEACNKITLQDNVEKILHEVQTYQIALQNAISALQENDPTNYLKVVIQTEKDKDVKSIVDEMRSLGHPETVLKTIEEVLQTVLDQLPFYKFKDLDEAMRDEGIKEVKNLDFLNPNPEKLVKILLGLSVAVEDVTTGKKVSGYFPRASQLAALLSLLLSKSPDSSTCLLEIATGEGKSCIIAMFALIQAIRGKTVDIITSSPVLARRDHEEWKKIYEMFNITCSVVPPQGLDECSNSKERHTLINDAYSKDIVYGTVDNFAADILRQEFEKKETRGNRKFDIAIVDEVDYMTLDNGVQITYLSHDATGMRHLDQLLCAIWARVCMCQRIEEGETGDILWTTRVQYFHKLAVDAVLGQEKSANFSPNEFLVCAVQLGLISEEDLQIINAEDHSSDSSSKDLENSPLASLLKKFGPSQQKDLFTIFGKAMGDAVKFKFYELKDGKASFVDSSCTGENENTISVLLLEEGKACLLMTEKDLTEATTEDILSKTKYSNSYTHSVKERDSTVILLPGHLNEFINNRLRLFVENALRAIMMENGREYTIDCPENVSSTTSECIIPIDFKATGVLEKNKRWGDGLQQFLEIKHQLAITALSHVTNFMSNFHFFQRYTCNSGIYGVSGTLGDETDFKFLKKQYKTSCYVMPTHRYTKKVELPVQQVEGGRELWLQEICNCVKLRTSPKTWLKGQAVLVVCEDVKTAEELQGKLMDLKTNPDKITLYTRNDKHNIEMKVFDSEEIILATNLGGRGTDIKVTEEVNHSGGLSVILTHFPPNKRVEKQIFGRTSRKGNPGMVQMILNQQDLAPCYQGQPMEVIRGLREKYETGRILDMEYDELLEINIRHELFTFFCNFLEQFKENYSLIEQEDIYRLNDVNKYMSILCNESKLDYQPALNALKETWALWLTLHEEDINNHKDVDLLKHELKCDLSKTSEYLLQGKSNNFYDFIKVAMDHTYLHINNKSHDHGALAYWKKAENADGAYKAISLYNRAFILINLGKENYINEAISLLKETKETMNVYVSEVSNTNSFGKMTQFSKFKPHNPDTNFTLQNETRMNLLKSWANYIDDSLEKLQELQEKKEDAQTKEIHVFSLYEGYDTLVADELSLLYDYGLSIVFEVEKKPRFCIDALVCFILGALQVLAGIAVWVVSLGQASQFGMGLISEGISDMISGAIGMIKGSFDWAEWAISKAVSIGLSLVTAGVFALCKAAKVIYKVAKELWNGTRTLTSVAKDMIKSGKTLVSSITTSVKSVASTITKDTVTQSIKKIATDSATKEIIKKSVKYAGKELCKEAALKALEYGLDKGVESAFKEIVNTALKEEFSSILKESKQLEEALISFIVANAVPESTLKSEHPENYKINVALEKKIKKTLSASCHLAFTETVGDDQTLEKVNQGLGTTCKFVVKILKAREVSQTKIKGIALSIHLLEVQIQIAEVLRSSPSRTLINDKIIPNLVSQITDSSSCSKDVRHDFPEVKRLKTELQDVVFRDLFDSFNDLLASKLTGLLKMAWENPYIRKGTQRLAKEAGQWIKKVPMKNFFISQTEKLSGNIKSNKTKSDNLHLGEPSKEEIHTFVQNVQEGHQPVTNLELKVLAKSKLLKGQGIVLTAVQKDGKKLSTDRYPGSDSSAKDILLQFHEGSESGKHQFILLNADGKVLFKPGQGEKGLYQALSHAIQKRETDVDQLVVKLKNDVNNEMDKNLDQYLLLVKKELQRQKLRDLEEKYRIA
ncbi:uncharacterized protein O3C94_014301 [Discoglossus pictus]